MVNSWKIKKMCLYFFNIVYLFFTKTVLSAVQGKRTDILWTHSNIIYFTGSYFEIIWLLSKSRDCGKKRVSSPATDNKPSCHLNWMTGKNPRHPSFCAHQQQHQLLFVVTLLNKKMHKLPYCIVCICSNYLYALKILLCFQV